MGTRHTKMDLKDKHILRTQRNFEELHVNLEIPDLLYCGLEKRSCCLALKGKKGWQKRDFYYLVSILSLLNFLSKVFVIVLRSYFMIMTRNKKYIQYCNFFLKLFVSYFLIWDHLYLFCLLLLASKTLWILYDTRFNK